MKILLPAKLKDALEQAARANKRSLNAEVVACLEEALGGVNHHPGESVVFDPEKIAPAVQKIHEALALLDTTRGGSRGAIEAPPIPSSEKHRPAKHATRNQVPPKLGGKAKKHGE